MRRLPLNNPQQRWARTLVDYEGAPPQVGLEVYEDLSETILSHNDSPDLGFRWSANPYRGCAHGCSYCYARPSHEYLSFGAGTDFERKLLAKPRAAELLAQSFERNSWQGELVLLSGNTDCYQPLEAEMELTRACLEVFLRYKNPVHIITKSALIERDLSLLQALNASVDFGVTVSIPFWNAEICRGIEPYAPAPRRRIEIVRRLSEAGIHVSVNVAPIIPGLNSSDLLPILEAAREAGARRANMIPVRLPGPVKEVFFERLEQVRPLSVAKVRGLILEMRGGKLNDSRFGSRMRGEGAYMAAVSQAFEATRKRLGFETGSGKPHSKTFERPQKRGDQLTLFK